MRFLGKEVCYSPTYLRVATGASIYSPVLEVVSRPRCQSSRRDDVTSTSKDVRSHCMSVCPGWGFETPTHLYIRRQQVGKALSMIGQDSVREMEFHIKFNPYLAVTRDLYNMRKNDFRGGNQFRTSLRISNWNHFNHCTTFQ